MSNKKSYFELLLLVLAAGAIYPLIYLRTNFQEPLLSALNMSMEELSQIYSFLGMMFIVGYVPSGWLADRFPAKWLILFSLVATGLLGIWLATLPGYTIVRIIFIGFGFSAVFTFWSALMKAVKMLTTPQTEGKFFGILDGGRGLVEALLATLAVAIFVFISNKSANNSQAMQAVILMYSIMLFILSVAIFFFLTNTSPTTERSTEHKTKKDSPMLLMKTILSIKEVWLISAIIFTGYTLFWTVYYFSGFLVSNQGVTPEIAGFILVIVMWMRPIGGIIGGMIADKIGKSTLLLISMIISIIGLLLIALLPLANALIFAIIILVGLANYTIRGVYWSLLQFLNIPATLLGMAIGLISFLGYLPDILLPGISSYIYGQFSSDKANIIYFIISATVGIIGLLFVLYFKQNIENKWSKKE
ncbi:MFS transporter [Entomospira culicis]|uniref:MFS transporter n=1 Tax=Entomospira culicis TaxID=2719989 RepID=A0A968GEN0_9SPIO|nr:MFS transporter [Entomospira culicis]NIZ18929.1 MFS transporter [Entomospira culicis]NIZ69144.1 MFS transporter [Entomospira culicis]WDI37730.1 MFS transporter [Entomospira culicis]WDI39358.1 MFS transporter [Entomospira culicis]